MARRYARRASREWDHSWKFVHGNLFWSFRSFRIRSGGNSLRQYVGPDFCCLEVNITCQYLESRSAQGLRSICEPGRFCILDPPLDSQTGDYIP